MTPLDRAIDNYCRAVEAHNRASADFQKAADSFLENERKGLEIVSELRKGIETLRSKLDTSLVLGVKETGAYFEMQGRDEFERSVPSLPEGKAACLRLSCQRIVDQEELSERGWCPGCERLDLTRVQLKKKGA